MDKNRHAEVSALGGRKSKRGRKLSEFKTVVMLNFHIEKDIELEEDNRYKAPYQRSPWYKRWFR